LEIFMSLTRRQLLGLAGIGGAGLVIEASGVLMPFGVRPALADNASTFNGRGLFGGTTTLDLTVLQAPRQDLTTWTDYVKLKQAPGEGHVLRTDLLAGLYQRPTRTLEAFVQMTDLHIIDDKSPGRVEFVDSWADLSLPYNPNMSSAYRPHEIMSTHIVEAMVQAIRNVARGPMTGLPLAFTIVTGDVTDNLQHNEVRWYIDLLDGGKVIQVESGVIGDGQSVTEIFNGAAPGHHSVWYWSPEGLLDSRGMVDNYRATYHLPLVRGLVAAARRAYVSTGLGMPWYAVMGNHDAELQGNYPLHPSFVVGLELPDIAGYATGTDKPWMSGWSFPGEDPDDVALFVNSLVSSSVPADNRRGFLDRDAFAGEHFITVAGQPGGHGFVSLGKDVFRRYYSRASNTAPITYITLDTNCYDGGAGGRIPADQYHWLESQLQANSTNWYDDKGTWVSGPGSTNRLIVVFGHHTIDTIDNHAPDQVDLGDTDFYYAPAVERLLLRYPNVILYVCGHTHRNTVKAHRRGIKTDLDNSIPGQSGFWEVSSASHIDWPVQSRVFELAIGRGLISIFATMVDIAAPIDYAGDLNSPASLASLARELAANDPTERVVNSANSPARSGSKPRRGGAGDRNVQLIVRAPFFIGAPDPWGSTVTVTPNSTGNLEVFGTRSDDTISLRHQSSLNQWGAWGGFPVGGLLHAVSATTDLNHQMHLFGANTGSYGEVFHSGQTTPGGSWTQWASLGRVDARSIAAIGNKDGRLEVFITTPGGDVWHIAQQSPGGAWGNWSPAFGLSGTRFCQVAAVQNVIGQVELYALADHGAVYQRAQIATGGWTAWHLVFDGHTNVPDQVNGAVAFTKVAAALDDNAQVVLYLIDHDGRIWWAHIIAGNAGLFAQEETGTPAVRMTQIAVGFDTIGLRLVGVDHAGQIWTRTRGTALFPRTLDWAPWSALSDPGQLRPDVPGDPGAGYTYEHIITPNLIGLTEAVAQQMSLAVGFRVIRTNAVNPAPVGTVCAQTPAPGAVAFENDEMVFTISQGQATVPHVTGLDKDAASNLITSVGLDPDPSVTNSTIVANTVLSQSPQPGTAVPPGSIVRFTYSSGPSNPPGGGGGDKPPIKEG
jgi:metallophosphoesterase (TIGR03767 family)